MKNKYVLGWIKIGEEHETISCCCSNLKEIKEFEKHIAMACPSNIYKLVKVKR